MKPLEASKSRLAPVMDRQQREALAFSMLRRVLRVSLISEVQQTWVVGGGRSVWELADQEGASWQPDIAGDLNSCLVDAFKRSFEQGMAPLYLPADLPLLTVEEIDGLTTLFGSGSDPVIAPDSRGEGTNAMLLPVGSMLTPSLGPGSFDRHQQKARELDLNPAIYQAPGFDLDLDTPRDLETLERKCPGMLNKLIEEARHG